MGKRYLAYLVRLWQVEDGPGATWRASLENPHTGECHAFASHQALYAFLEALIADQPPPPEAPPTREPHP